MVVENVFRSRRRVTVFPNDREDLGVSGIVSGRGPGDRPDSTNGCEKGGMTFEGPRSNQNLRNDTGSVRRSLGIL